MTKRNGFTAFVVTLFSILAISGCARETNLVSVPLEIPEGVIGEIDQNLFTGQLNEFRFSVEIHNVHPLGVRLTFEADDNHYAVKPILVNIVTNSGEHVKPLTFLGPSEPWVSPRAFLRGCGPRRHSLGTAPSKIDLSANEILSGNPDKGVLLTTDDSVPFTGNVCFMFWYDYKPVKDQIFYLSIEGVSKSGIKVQIPELRFGSGLVTKTMVFP